MPRPRKDPDKWNSPRTEGAVHSRDGFAVMRFNGNKRACGLRFHPDNQRACIEMLEKWVLSIQFPELNGSRSPQSVDVPSLFGAIERFEEVRYPALGHRAKKNYDRAFSYFAKKDVPLEYRNVCDMVVHRNSAAISTESGEQLAHNTRHNTFSTSRPSLTSRSSRSG
jgi:hypothetical protein